MCSSVRIQDISKCCGQIWTKFSGSITGQFENDYILNIVLHTYAHCVRLMQWLQPRRNCHASNGSRAAVESQSRRRSCKHCTNSDQIWHLGRKGWQRIDRHTSLTDQRGSGRNMSLFEPPNLVNLPVCGKFFMQSTVMPTSRIV